MDGGQEQRRLERGETKPPRRRLTGLAAGYLLVAALVVGFAIGWLIDRRFDTTPWWTVGVTGALILTGLYRVAKDHTP